MRKFAVLLLAALALASCGLFGPGKPEPLGAIGSGSGAYFIEASAEARSARAAYRAEGDPEPVPGTLMRIENGEAGAVVFYDETGAAVAVTVDNARTLSDGRLVLGVTYAGSILAFIADPASGALLPLSPVPEGWTYARESGGFFYYIGGGGLWRASLATGAASRVSPEGDALSSGAWLKIPSYGGVLYVAEGDTYEGSPAQRYYPGAGVEAVKTNLQVPDPRTANAIEGLDGTIYSFGNVTPGVSELHLYTYAESGTSGGYLSDGTYETIALPWEVAASPIDVSAPGATGEKVLGYAYGILRIKASAGGLDFYATLAPGEWESIGSTFIGSFDALTTYAEGEVYHAYHEIPYAYGPSYDVERFHIWRVPLNSSPVARTLIGGEPVAAEVLVDRNVSGLIAVGGALFYTRDAAGGGRETVLYDGVEAVVYAPGEVQIQPVN